MNVFGIDYQQTLTVISLREGNGYSARLCNVGDGIQSLIPNTVIGEELWGSQSLKGGRLARITEIESLQDGPWLSQLDASTFWHQIYHRLYSFLGRIEPVPHNGYQLVIGLQSANYSSAAREVEKLCSTAGFERITCISSHEAVLSRWLAERALTEVREELVVVVIVVGDVSTVVFACQLLPNQRTTLPPYQVTETSHPIYLAKTGLAYWTAKLLQVVCERFSEPIPSSYELAMRDAAIEFGIRLGKADPLQLLDWTGPLREKMYTSLDLTRTECERWLEVSRLTAHLPKAIQEALYQVTARRQPDKIIVGGVGALWPFARDVVAGMGTVWQSSNPEEDVARGAAWWPEVGLGCPDVRARKSASLDSFKPEEEPTVQTTTSTLDSETDPKLIPPWKR